PDQRSNFGACTGDVEFFTMRAHQLAGAVVVVDPDRQAMYPCLARTRRGATLGDGEPGEPAVGVDVEVGAKGVETGRLQPLPAPVGKVATRRLLQRAEQVVECGVVERVGAKVIA